MSIAPADLAVTLLTFPVIALFRTIAGVQFLRTPSFVQVTGVGDLTKINVKADDDGGELDPFGADNRGNPVGVSYSPMLSRQTRILTSKSKVSRALMSDLRHRQLHHLPFRSIF